ncbi:acid phosphatase [Silvimonas amylolytica]|uniref:phospholipase C n=1 Tax=Silvimonas amylolytica TaxID=449663 RepID=A0ABQ2PIH0_9NEIS|nr:acid phosphatase [Silvimonas amylolytica]GGP25399.1 acid phosphatase [Silvimonas amylolytica]
MTQPVDPQQIDASDLPTDPTRRRVLEGLAAVSVAGVLPLVAEDADAAKARPQHTGGPLDARLSAHVKNIVVIYLENRSFNNLYGDFPGVLDPLSSLTAAQYTQTDRNGQPLPTLPKIWGGLVQRGQTVGGKYYMIKEEQIDKLPNAPFPLKDTEGQPLPEAVITRDLWHLFYQNQMQINGGKNDQFAAWADSGGLVMGYYDQTARNLNMYQIARQFTLCDRFFMAAFGGSYMNHQFLAAARANVYPDVANSVAAKKIAKVDGGPQGTRLTLHAENPASALDGKPKFANDGAMTPDGFAVNTMAPPYQPSFIKPAADGDKTLADPNDPATLPPQSYDTIGDLLTRKGVSWAWYAGGWQAALDGKGGPDQPNFQFHHQPFNYFKQFGPGTAARAEHLRDGGMGDSPMSNRFLADAVAGKLPAVTFYKPQGNLNMHAGYSDVESGDRHVANILMHLMSSPQWKNMVVVITHDENGGWWDHVAPPQGDRWGPGSRIPALVVSPFARRGHVDHTFYDTTSILRFISRVHGLPKLEGIAERDAAFKSRGTQPPGDLTGALQV